MVDESTSCGRQAGRKRYSGSTATKRLRRLPALGALSLAIAVACAAPLHAQNASEARDYAISSQPLGAALNQLALTADRQIMVPPELVRGRTAPALSGHYSLDVALKQLLAGSGLTYEITGKGTVMVKRASPGPSTPAKSTSASSEEVDQPPEPATLQSVTVTGTRLKRTDFEGPSPVITISRQDIERSGASTVHDVMSALPQNSVAIDESGANTYAGASTVQLRGLSLGSTLILINGRRASSYNGTFFDLNSIPLEAVERIDVLTDTASAIYGADAIGGAINFILKDDYEGAGLSLHYGISSHGDAAERQASYTVGGKSDRYSGLFVLDVFDRDPLFGGARELTRSSDFRRYGGLDMRSSSSYPANVYALPGTGNLPGLDHPYAGVPAGMDGIGLTPADFASTDGVLNKFDSGRYSSLIAKTHRISAFAQGSARISSTVETYGELLLSRNHQQTSFGPDSLSGGANGIFVVPADNPFNPFGVPVGVDYKFVELGPGGFDTTNDYSRFLVGVSGSFLDRFDWDVNMMSDRNEQVSRDVNLVQSYLPGQAALIQQYLDSTDPATALNVFSTTGNNNPDTLNALRHGGISSSNSMHANTLEATLRGSVASLPAGDVQMAVGGTVRRDSGKFESGMTSLEAHSKSSAVFVEALVPLVSPDQHLPGLYSAEADLAVRRDWFDAFGSQTSPQFGLTWRPVRSLLVRGSYGKAFKAPSLSDLYSSQFTGISQGIPDPLRGNEVSNFLLTNGGNPNIKPERARSMTLGAIWEPGFLEGLSVGLTTFRIKHEAFITRFSDYQTMMRHPELFGDRIVRAAPTQEDIAKGWPGRLLSLDASMVNYGGVEVHGSDVDLRYAFPRSRLGRFTWSFLGSYIDQYKVQLVPGAPAHNEVGHANRAGYPTHLKGTMQLAWTGESGFGAALAARYTGSYIDYVDFNNVYHTLPSQTRWDAQFSYRDDGSGWLGLRGFRAELGVTNLTDNQGHFSNAFSGYDFQQADLRGRFFYLNLHQEF